MKQQSPKTPFGFFVRTRRLQCNPDDFGVAATGRRRTPGLRREELAQLCGISITWLTWIEQGRATSVSAPTLLALARGLRFTRAERDYLFRLAGKSDPAPHSEEIRDQRLLQRLVDGFGDAAYVLDRHWDAVVWNRAAAALFPHWLKRPSSRAAHSGERANLLHYVFLTPAARRQVMDWKERSQRVVAEFRADTAALRGDALSDALVAELSQRSKEFATTWDAQRVRAREGGERRFRDARGRVRRFEQVTLRVAHQPELKLVLLISPTTAR